MDSRGSPGLRTPTSRPGIHLSATPSPFRSFRLSTSNSPPSGDRALRLSNCENVIGFRYRDGCIEKTFQIGNMTDPYHIEAAETAKASRCLQMPSTSDDTSFDRTLPMTMGDGYEVDGVMTDDSGLFGNDVVLHATSTPLHSSPQPYLSCTTSVPSVPNPYSDIREPKVEMMPCEDVMTKSSPPTPSSFKRAMRDVQRQGILQPRKLLTDNLDVPVLEKEITEKKPDPIKQVEDVNEALKRRRQCAVYMFEPPKKPLKPYSRRWMRLVTGGTRTQREMTAAAHFFIARLSKVREGSC